jgi:hypothetical protein
VIRYLPALAVLVVLAAGCGSSGSSDSDQIRALVNSEGRNPASICRHLSDALVTKLGGQAACVKQAASSAKDPSTHARAISVHGDTATAVIVDRAGTITISLLKEKGIWKVAAVR